MSCSFYLLTVSYDVKLTPCCDKDTFHRHDKAKPVKADSMIEPARGLTAQHNHVLLILSAYCQL